MIVSHNTFSYLTPIGLLGKLLIPISRCQKNDVWKQDFDIADIRVRHDKGVWWICHGPVKYCSLLCGLELLHIRGIKHVRILIEFQSEVSMLEYLNLEEYLKDSWSDISFYTGRRRSDWRKVLDLPDIPNLTQYVGSMEGGWIGKVCPWIWWYFYGRHHKDEMIGKTENTSLDFL